MDEVIKCTQCKKKFLPEGFKTNRLGLKNKTCLECADRRKKGPKQGKPLVPTLLKNAIIEKSESDEFEKARWEWDYLTAIYDPVETNCLIVNKLNGNELVVVIIILSAMIRTSM